MNESVQITVGCLWLCGCFAVSMILVVAATVAVSWAWHVGEALAR